MRKSLAVIALLSCAVLALAQEPRGGILEQAEPGLLPAPMVTTFDGERLYRPGEKDTKPPVVLVQPEPTPLKNMRPARVVLWCVVGTDGKAHMIKIARRDTMESEMKAVDNLRQWTFKPAAVTQSSTTTKVNMLIPVEVVWQ